MATLVQLADHEHRRLASDPLPGRSADVVILPCVRIERHDLRGRSPGMVTAELAEAMGRLDASLERLGALIKGPK